MGQLLSIGEAAAIKGKVICLPFLPHTHNKILLRRCVGARHHRDFWQTNNANHAVPLLLIMGNLPDLI